MAERVPVQWRGKTAEVIVNPRAGGGKNLEQASQIVAFLEKRGLRVTPRFTEKPLHAQELAENAAKNGVDLLWAVGGDGTLNEIVNGAAGSETAVAAFPTGTVNIWGHEAEIPFDPETAVDATLNGTFHYVDLLNVLWNGKPRKALLGIGYGYDGHVFNAVHNPGETRERNGENVYLRTTVRELPHAVTPKVVFSVDGKYEKEMDHFGQGWVLNTQRLTQLKGRPVILDSQEQIDNGRALFIGYKGRLRNPMMNMLGIGRRIALDGLLQKDASRFDEKHEGIIFQFHSEVPLYLQGDGEPWGQTTDLSVAVLPGALRVLVPQQQETTIFQRPGVPAALLTPSVSR